MAKMALKRKCPIVQEEEEPRTKRAKEVLKRATRPGTSGDDSSSSEQYESQREARSKLRHDLIKVIGQEVEVKFKEATSSSSDPTSDDDEKRVLKGRGRGGERGNVQGPKLRSRVALKMLRKLVKKFKGHHKQFIEGTVLKPLLSYPALEMDRHAALALVNAWEPEKRGFRLGTSLVKFTKYDVALLTGLPVEGKKVNLGLMEVFSSMGSDIKKLAGPRRGANVLQAVRKLCKASLGEDDLGKFGSLFAFYCFSTVLFPRNPNKVAWHMEAYATDLQNLGRYAWAEAVWRFLVEGLDDLKEKLPTIKTETGVIGFSILLQCWLYEHNRTLSKAAPKLFPRIRRWGSGELPSGKRVYELVQSFPGEEIVPVLQPMAHEKDEKVVSDFIHTIEWEQFVAQTEEDLSPEEVARLARERERNSMKKLRSTEEELEAARVELVELKNRVADLETENKKLRARLNHEESPIEERDEARIEDPVVDTPIEAVPIRSISTVLRGGIDEAVFSEIHVEKYLQAPLSETDLELVNSAREEFQAMQDRKESLTTATWTQICADYITGLLNKVPKSGPGMKDHSVGSMAVGFYCILLRKRQEQFPHLCHQCVFLDRCFKMEDMSPKSCKDRFEEVFVRTSQKPVRFVFTPILNDFHWFLVVSDIKREEHYLLDSMKSNNPQTREIAMIAISNIGDALLQLDQFKAPPTTWKLIPVECPQQSNGHDCGVFLMAFMDVLSIKGPGLFFDQECVPNMRERILASIIKGEITNFPTFLGEMELRDLSISPAVE